MNIALEHLKLKMEVVKMTDYICTLKGDLTANRIQIKQLELTWQKLLRSWILPILSFTWQGRREGLTVVT